MSIENYSSLYHSDINNRIEYPSTTTVNSDGFLRCWTGGGVNSRPGGHGVLELMWTDGPGFSLCAAPLESSGPGFCGVEQRLDEQAEVQVYIGPELSERTCRGKRKDSR